MEDLLHKKSSSTVKNRKDFLNKIKRRPCYFIELLRAQALNPFMGKTD
jgi:hypothetical protein